MYVGHLVGFSNKPEELKISVQKLSHKLKFDLKISTAKLRYFISQKNPDQCVLQKNGATLKQVEKFKYLGVAFTSNSRQDEELDYRIAKASAVM